MLDIAICTLKFFIPQILHRRVYYSNSHFIDGETDTWIISFLQNHVINNWWN